VFYCTFAGGVTHPLHSDILLSEQFGYIIFGLLPGQWLNILVGVIGGLVQISYLFDVGIGMSFLLAFYFYRELSCMLLF